MRDRDGPWRPPPCPRPPPRSPRDPRLSLQRGDARGQEAFTKAASLHPSILPSLLLPIPPSFRVSVLSTLHPFIFLSPLSHREVSSSRNGKNQVSYLKKKRKKYPAKWSKFPISPPALSPRAPRGHSSAAWHAAQPGGNNIQQPCKERRSLFKPAINPTYLAAIWT